MAVEFPLQVVARLQTLVCGKRSRMYRWWAHWCWSNLRQVSIIWIVDVVLQTIQGFEFDHASFPIQSLMMEFVWKRITRQIILTMWLIITIFIVSTESGIRQAIQPFCMHFRNMGILFKQSKALTIAKSRRSTTKDGYYFAVTWNI